MKTTTMINCCYAFKGLLLLLLLAVTFHDVLAAFVSPPVSSSTSTVASHLHGLSEWRDEVSEHKEVPLHLVPSSEVPLPGETKYFQFQTKAELRLFQQAMDKHHGIFGLGLIVAQQDDGETGDRQSQQEETMLETFALMEILDCKNMNLGVDLGVFCTAQAVGRASLLKLKDYHRKEIAESSEIKGPLVAECMEYLDDPESHFSLEEVNTMAKDVVEMIAMISQKEQRSMEHGEDTHDTEARTDRFQMALRDVYVTDTQGYTMPSKTAPGLRSWKELNAISWAAFSSSTTRQWEETHRLHALDMQRITTRIQLASFWLSDVLVDAESN
jgi:hypothetical protein